LLYGSLHLLVLTNVALRDRSIAMLESRNDHPANQAILVNVSLPEQVSIRPLAATDSISAITRLLHAAYRPLAEAGMRYVTSHQDDERTRIRCAKGDCYVAEMKGEIVGTVTLSTVENTKGTPWHDRSDVASFGQFAVKPELQRFRIGSRLMDTVEARAKDLGVAEIALDTSEHASHLIRYYQSRGYRFIEHTRWSEVNYRSVILSKSQQKKA
jgi:predicted N-acetyltransferase YhbS